MVNEAGETDTGVHDVLGGYAGGEGLNSSGILAGLRTMLGYDRKERKYLTC